jgi:FecR protein
VQLKSALPWILLQFVILAILVGPALSSVVPKNSQDSTSGNPSGNIEDKHAFTPGFGRPVGEVVLSFGRVVITHKEDPEEFPAKTGRPLYNGDTVTTGKNGKIRFRLNDGSIITLSSTTKLVIDKSIYKPKQKRRSSFLRMVIGKARFIVTKMFTFREKEFKVKTGTFVAGVRGSDFVIVAKKNSANLTAMKDTSVVVTGFAAPEKPVIVNDYQRTIVPKGRPPEKITDVPMDEIKKLEKMFDMKKGGEGKEDSTKDSDDSDDSDKPDTSDTRIPPESLIPPGTTTEPDHGYEPEEPIYPEREQAMHDDENRDINEQIVEEIRQEAVGEELPDMPGTPE